MTHYCSGIKPRMLKLWKIFHIFLFLLIEWVNNFLILLIMPFNFINLIFLKIYHSLSRSFLFILTSVVNLFFLLFLKIFLLLDKLLNTCSKFTISHNERFTLLSPESWISFPTCNSNYIVTITLLQLIRKRNLYWSLMNITLCKSNLTKDIWAPAIQLHFFNWRYHHFTHCKDKSLFKIRLSANT